jgi:hypothetical protein
MNITTYSKSEMAYMKDMLARARKRESEDMRHGFNTASINNDLEKLIKTFASE